MTALAAAHGLDGLIAPVRPTWKERYPLSPIESYLRWRRDDGLLYDPWLRTHERLGAEVLGAGPAVADDRRLPARSGRSWTELTYPEDGDYIVPGALAPVRFEGGRGVYVEPNVWMRHPC